MSHPHQIEIADTALQFALGGNARFTLVSKKTGARFTYKVRAKMGADEKTADIYFVSLLTGSDNESDYTYMGCIRPVELQFFRTNKSPIGPDAPSYKAMDFFWRHLIERSQIHEGLEFWHEGACCRCGRTLTTPESLTRGVGPECAGKMGIGI